MEARQVLLAIRRSQSRTAYTIALRAKGFRVMTADHGLECLEVLNLISPDVIVIEPELLWGGGDGVLAILSENPERQRIPVLVLTTGSNRSAVYSVSQFPVSDFCVQPVAPEQLTACIVNLTGGSKSRFTAVFNEQPSS